MVVVGGYGSINSVDPKKAPLPIGPTVRAALGVLSAFVVVGLVAVTLHPGRIALFQDGKIPVVSKVYDDTGRYLSPAAIASTAISSHAGTSSDEMAVLEAAAGLKAPKRLD